MKNLTHIQDKDIALAIEEELLADEGVPAHLIDVETKEGIAILSGVTNTLQARDRASEITETIRGVRAVVNQIAVKPTPRGDKEIYEDISKALFFDPATHAYPIDIAVEDGIVTLTGTVDSWQKKELSGWVVKGVKGIRELHNEIIVEPKTQRPDIEIENEIKRRMELDVWIDDALINVEVNDGAVELSGVVGSAIERTRAYLDAWVEGVNSVNSRRLKVDERRDRSEMRQENKFALRTDQEIKWAIEGAFLYDPRILSFNPQVGVNNGIVTLTGVVDNLQSKKAAEQDAGNTIGVWQVKNYLKVRPVDPPDDLEIAENVRKALLWNPDVDRHQLVVSCHNGKVYLHGTVFSNYEKNQAEDVSQRIRGVVEVENNLRVNREWRWRSDEEIKENIESRFQRNIFIDADQINITVQDGIATVSGSVDIWQQRNIIIENALKGGAKSVMSRLKVMYITEEDQNEESLSR